MTNVRTFLDAFHRQGAEAALAHLHEELRIFPAVDSGEPVIRGHEGFAAHNARLASGQVEVDANYHEFEDVGDGRVLVGGDVKVAAPGRPAEERPAYWIMTVVGDRVSSVAAHGDRAEALRSIGRFS